MPRMIVGAVPAEPRRAAPWPLNQVLRTVGYSIGSALAATILTAHTASSAVFPSDSGYTVGALVGLGLCLLAALLSWVLPHRRVATPLTAEQELEIEDDVDAAISGTITLEDGVRSLGRAG